MSALDDLLAEVRVEAEIAVRTEYENTVVNLRAENEELIRECESLEAALFAAQDEYRELESNYVDVIDAVKKLAASL